MLKTQMLIMGGALVIALLVAVIAMKVLAPKQPVVVGLEVLVASHDLLAGNVLKEEDTKWESFPENAVYGGLIQRRGQLDNKPDVYGKPLKRDIQSGEPITPQSLVEGSGNYLAATLQPGMRAVAISVRPETMAGGFITPGDYVDAILNFQVSLRGDAANFSDQVVQKFASETILSNVLVLAVDQDNRNADHSAKVGRTVTLEVDEKGAQTLVMASSMGEISLALRKLGEKDEATNKAGPLTTDINVSKVIQKIYNVESLGGSKTQDTIVRMYSGGSVTNIPVRSTHAGNGRE